MEEVERNNVKDCNSEVKQSWVFARINWQHFRRLLKSERKKKMYKGDDEMSMCQCISRLRSLVC